MLSQSGPPMPPPVGRNWEMFMEEQILHGPDEVDLRTLRSGDRLEVVTKNTRYQFEWLQEGGVLLRTDRTDRPWGQVTLNGCAFRRSGIVVPHVIFRGGKLDFISMQGQLQHRTTVIVSYTLTRQNGAGCALRESVLVDDAR